MASLFVEAAREFLPTAGEGKGGEAPAGRIQAAYLLFSRALEMNALGTDEETVRWESITCLSRGSFDPQLVLRDTQLFAEKFPKSSHLDEVASLRGQVLLAQGRWWEAKKVWEGLLKDHPNSPRGPQVLYELARFHGIHKRITDFDEIYRGIGYLNRLVQRYPDHELTRTALWETALTYNTLPQLKEDSVKILDGFVQKYPQDERTPQGMLLMGDIYLALQQEDRALGAWEQLLTKYPDVPATQEARSKIADLRFQKGYKSYLKKDFESARRVFADFAIQYPVDGRLPWIGYLAGEMLQREKKFKEAVDQWQKTAAKYPNSDVSSRCRFAAGETLHQDMGNFDDAFGEYEQAQFGPWGNLAKQRLAEVKSKQLWIESDRLFTSQEVPYIAVTSRNVRDIRFRVNVFSLEDYQAKKMSFKELSQLQNKTVVAPDKEWVFSIKDYQAYRSTTGKVDLPFRAPGVYIVTASPMEQGSETDRLAGSAPSLESTAVCMVTDMAFVARIGPGGMTLLAQNRLTGDSIEQPALRVASGGRLIAGPSFPADLDVKEGAILATFSGQSAFQDFALAKTDPAPELKPQAFLICDRTVCRPGEAVHVKLIVRDVAGRNYVAPSTERKYFLRWVSPNKEVFREEGLTLTSAGTASAELQIPPAGSLGEWRIQVLDERRDPEHALTQQSCLVVQPAPSVFRVAFDLAEKTYFIGDEIDVTAFVTDLSGRPVARRKMFYQLSGWTRWEEAATSDGGSLAIKITETEQFYRDREIVLTLKSADTGEGGFTGQVTIPLTPKGFEITFVRAADFNNAILVGEDRPILFQTRQFDGTPTSQEIRWELFRFNEAQEKIVEQGSTLTTDNKGPTALTFRCSTRGPYVLSLQGRDGRGLPVMAVREFVVYDAQDRQKLFIRSDRDEFSQGDEAALEIVSNLDRCTGFLTVEQDRTIHTERVTLEKGKNSVKLDLKGFDARSVRVTISVVHGQEFHTADRAFSIRKSVTLAVTPDKKEYEPGDEVRLQVRVTDQNGRPRKGEVAVLVSDDFHAPPDFSSLSYPAVESAGTTVASNTHRFGGLLPQTTVEFREAQKRQLDLEQQKNSPARMPLWVAPTKVEEPVKLPQPSGARERNGSTTLFWDPAVTVKEDGTAEVRFQLPRRNARWAVSAWVATEDILLSSTQTILQVNPDLTMTLVVPDGVLQKEETSASVFIKNSSTQEKKGEVEWVVHLAGQDVPQKTPFTVAAGSIGEVRVPFRPEVIGDGSITAVVGKIKLTGFFRIESPMASTLVSEGGWTDQGSAVVTLRSQVEKTSAGRLTVYLSLSAADFLRALRDQARDDVSGPALAEAAWMRSQLSLSPDGKTNAVQEAISRLVLLQRANGSWGYPGSEAVEDPLDPLTTAFVYEGIVRANKAGYAVPATALAKATEYLKTRFSSADGDEVKVILLHALSYSGEANPVYIDRLTKDRDRLSTRGLALLARLLWTADKKDQAKEVGADLEKRALIEEQTCLWTDNSTTPLFWAESRAAVTSLALSALQQVLPNSAAIDKGVRGLLSHRGTGMWNSSVERALACEVLSRSAQFLTAVEPPARVTVSVAGKIVGTCEGKTARPVEIFETSAAEEPAEIKFDVEGSGPYLYYVVLERGLTEFTAERPPVQVQTTYAYPALTLDGQVLDTPAVSQKKRDPEPRLTRVASGQIFSMIIQATLQGEPADRWWVSVPVPSGCEVVSASSDIPVLVRSNRVMFTMRKPAGAEVTRTIDVKLYASHPGTYAQPWVILKQDGRSMITESRLAPAPFTVLPAGEDFREGYVPSASEQYSLGKNYFARKEFVKAREALLPLIDQGGVVDPYSAEVARMLLEVSIETNHPEEAIRFFDILKEKRPNEILPFEWMVHLSRAYKGMKEYVRHRQIVTGVIETYFLQEAGLAGIMDSAGQSRRSLELMKALLADYPDSPIVREMHYGLAHRLLTMGAAKKDPAERVDLLVQSVMELNRYLVLYPTDPRCDEVSLALASALLSLGDYNRAEELARSAAGRYPDSRYLDNYDYTVAYAQFAQKKFKDSLAMCDRLLTHDYGPKANPPPAMLKDMATMMKAQIYHAQGDLSQALEQYKKVKDAYTEAESAIKDLEKKALKVPDVAFFKPDQPTRLELEYVGSNEVTVKAYKIDLLGLYVKSKGNTPMEEDIIGHKPALEKQFTLRTGRSFRKETTTLELGLADVGAYLVYVRARDFSTSGLVVRSGLTLDVREDAQTGTVRVSVLDTLSGKAVDNIPVTFIASGDGKVVTQKSDMRGIAEVVGIKGTATVIAEKDGHYGLYRGTASLSGYVAPPQQPVQKSDKPSTSGGNEAQPKNTPDPLDVNWAKLKDVQDAVLKQYQQNLQKSPAGVEIQKTK